MRAFLVLGGLSLLGLFVGLGRLDWVDERESRDAWIARDLWVRRELLTPSLGGVPRFEKPLLAYLPEAASGALTPRSPVGPRAFKAALAVGLVLLTGVIGARWLGPRAGALGGAVLATSLVLPLAARTDGTQLLATSLGWLGWAGLAAATLGEGRPRFLLPSYLALAAAALVAGPFPALWPLGALLLHARWTPRADRPRIGAIAGLVLILGLSLPWYGAMLERHGTAFAWAVPSFPYGGDLGQPWYTAPARALGFLVVGFFPWSTLLPAAVLYRWTGVGVADLQANPPTRLLIATLAAALIPLLFAPAAPLPAVLPALPAAALLVGALLDRVFGGEALAGRATAQASWLVAGSGTVAALLLAWIARRLGSAAPELRLLATFLFVASWAPALAAFLGRARAVPALIGCLVAFGTAVAALRTLPALSDYLSAAPVATAMNTVSVENAPLFLVEPPPASLRLRLERRIALPARFAPALSRARRTQAWVYVAFPPRRESEVARAAAPAPLEILTRTPGLVLARISGR